MNTDKDVSFEVAADEAETFNGTTIIASAASTATRPRIRVFNKLKALPSQES